jgi:hypothetical protein
VPAVIDKVVMLRLEVVVWLLLDPPHAAIESKRLAMQNKERVKLLRLIIEIDLPRLKLGSAPPCLPAVMGGKLSRSLSRCGEQVTPRKSSGHQHDQ